MAQSARIPIPMKQHLLRFRVSILPGIAFLFCVVLTLWLWQRQATVGSIVGEVETYSVIVPAGGEGLLRGPSPNVFWRPNDPVKKGDVIAQIDDTLVNAQLNTVKLQANKLEADLEAAKAEWQTDQVSFAQDDAQQMLRLKSEVARLRIELLKASAEVVLLEGSLAGVQNKLKMAGDLTTSGAARMNRVEQVSLESERDQLKKSIGEAKRIYQVAKAQLDAAVQDLRAYSKVEMPQVDALLAPIFAEIKVQESLEEELRVQLQNLTIYAPMDGIITMVHRVPGIRVVPGDEIVTIEKPESGYVVSYVREKQQLPVYEGMRVGLRIRGDATAEQYDSMVETVGPAIQPVPLHQLADINTPERGLQIRIPLPAALKQKKLRPGQLLQVVFEAPDRTAR